MCNLFKNLVAILLIIFNLGVSKFVYAKTLPKDTRLYLQSYYAFKHGDMKRAIIYLGQIINNDEADKDTYEKLIAAYLIEDDFIDAYNIAVSMPESDQSRIAAFIKAVNNFKIGNFKAFDTKQQPLLNSVLDQISFKLMRAWSYYAMGKDDMAAKEIKMIEEAHNNNAQIDKFLSDEKTKKFTHALTMYNLALLYHSSNILKAEKYFDEALKSYRNSIANTVVHDRILINYIKLLQMHHEQNAAKQILHEEQKLYPDDAVITDLLNYISKDKPIEDSILQGQKAKTEFAKEAACEALSNIAAILANFDGIQAAWFYNRMALEINPYAMNSLWQYGSVIGMRNINSKQDVIFALAILNKVKDSSIYYFAAKIQQSLLLLQREEFDKSVDILHQLRAHYTSLNDTKKLDVIAYFLANIYVKNNEFGNAALVVKNILKDEKTHGKNWLLYYEAGIVYTELGDNDNAIKYFEIALEKSPNNAELLNYYGYVLLQNNKSPSKALQLLIRAASLDPANGYILDSLGWAYYYNKEYKKSIQCLQLAAQLLPFESEVIEHLGDAYWKNKDKTQAQYEWHNAINISKDKNNIERLNQKLINALSQTINKKTEKHSKNGT